jgi:hypothetical protein
MGELKYEPQIRIAIAKAKRPLYIGVLLREGRHPGVDRRFSISALHKHL